MLPSFLPVRIRSRTRTSVSTLDTWFLFFFWGKFRVHSCGGGVPIVSVVERAGFYLQSATLFLFYCSACRRTTTLVWSSVFSMVSRTGFSAIGGFLSQHVMICSFLGPIIGGYLSDPEVVKPIVKLFPFLSAVAVSLLLHRRRRTWFPSPCAASSSSFS